MATPSASVPDVESVRAILRQVIDPEVGVNIVDLGLVYRIDATPEQVLIEMTMTSPACPMGDMIMDDINAAIEASLPEDIPVVVQLVWEPPWNPGMMNESAREHFGWQSDR